MKNLLSIIKTSAIILILSGFCRTGEGYCQLNLLPNWPIEIGEENPSWNNDFRGGCSWVEPPNGEGEYYLCAFGFQTDPTHGIYLWDQYADSIPPWPLHDIWGFCYSPAAGDIDNDGQWEIVAVTQWRPRRIYVYAIELDGSTMDGWPIMIEQVSNSCKGQSVPVLYDLDGNGTLEIIQLGNITNRLSVWNYDGTDFPGWPLILEEDSIFRGSAVAVGDIDLDGEAEIITNFQKTHGDEYDTWICCYNADGSMVEGWPYVIEDCWYESYNHPTIADLDGDGYPEIIFTVYSTPFPSSGYLYVMEGDGSVKNGWPVYESVGINGSPVAADIDMDGLPEIVAPILREPDKFLTAYEFNGEYVEGFNGETWLSSVTYTDPIIADILNDEKPEIISTSNGGEFEGHGYFLVSDNMGNMFDWSPVQVLGLTFLWAPAVFSVYPESDRVLAVPTNYDITDSLNNIIGHHHLSYMYGLGPDEDFARPEWPRFAHDPQNTCNYHHPLQTSVGDGDNEQLPRNLRLYNYPNPFNARTNIIIDLPRESEVKVEVFNIYGQRMEKLIDERLEAGSHTLQWNAGACASGVYFYKLTTGKLTLSRKMVMVK